MSNKNDEVQVEPSAFFNGIKETLPVILADFYKASHRAQYPVDTKVVFSNWIPRTSRVPGINKVICAGVQNFNQEYLVEYFNDNFFDRDKSEVIEEYQRFMTYTMGVPFAGADHIAELHDLEYMPLTICSIPEGDAVPIGVPMITVINTNEKFFWATNYIETLISCQVWGIMTSTTLANEYFKILEAYAMATVGDAGFVPFQGHDFSMRGMYGVEAAILSSMGHMMAGFVGTDTMPAIPRLEYMYGANIEKELVGCSVCATEHSVQCVNGVETIEQEIAFAKRLITEVCPDGIVSMVSDTINLWDVILKVLPAIKDEIMERDGKFVIRPDSGDPVKIICGDPDASTEWERKGVVELLWDEFGGTETDKGFKLLDSHIGAIYGDSITIDRCREICKRLKLKGFASINVVFGIGSYTYQYNTRDTFGFAMKSTYAVVGDKEVQVYKDPITDNGTKKSLKGLCVVLLDEDGEYYVKDKLDMEEWESYSDFNQLQVTFKDGEVKNLTTLAEVRGRIRS